MPLSLLLILRQVTLPLRWRALIIIFFAHCTVTWCSDQWSPKVSGTSSQWVHACSTVENPFDAIHPILIPLQLSRVTSFLMWENQLKKSKRIRVSSRKNSQWKLHHGTCQALTSADKNRVCWTTWDGVAALTLQQGDNNLLTLSHHMLMMLQISWMMTTIPQCWKVLSRNHQFKWQKVSGLNHLVLVKKWGISSKKAINMICHTTHHSVYTVLHPFLLGSSGQMIVGYSKGC